ncbi:hypothetical protein Scep_014561 [Stephania cephalantha]|uniref:Uncharacterized protein n=1 Tax=Stephania cephalantha TaxID=152367 RepID=A0AAP0J2U5_9MAGN
MDTVEKKEGGESKVMDAQYEGAVAAVDTEREAEERERQNRELKAGLHPSKHKFVFWYTRRTP